MSNLYYVFDNAETANAAQEQIALLGGAPLDGHNAATGEIVPNATTGWATVQQRADGKYIFPKVPTEVLNEYPEALISDFNATFPYVFEEYSSDWFPSE